MADFARESALRILVKINEENAYSNIVLDEYLNENREKLNKKDINLISEIVYGTVTWRLTIDYIIQKYSTLKLKKMSSWVLNILRMGAYQIIFLDKIPKSAAVNESVKLCKKYAFKSTGLVNAILRKIEKNDYEEIYKIIQPKPIQINDICRTLKKDISQITPILTMMELEEYIEQLPGNQFKVKED